MRKLIFRKRLYCSVVALLFLFAVCSSNLHAVNDSGSGEVSIATNDSPQSPQESKIGTKAPKFSITKSGKSVSLSDFPYRYIVLNFSTSSPESRKINADIAKLEEQYKNADIAFVNLSFDENADIAKQYGVSTAPTICIINPDGVIVRVENGNVDLSKKLKDIFGI